jgi:DNA-binding CsgD family transcriptional regulator
LLLADSSGEYVGTPAAIGLMQEEVLEEAFATIDAIPNLDDVVAKLRNLLSVDHVVYYSKLGPSAVVPYIRLTYPAAWLKRYLEMGYGNMDPIVHEGFKRTLPFSWDELATNGDAERSFMADAVAHGIGPHGYAIPVVSKLGYRGLFIVAYSGSEPQWRRFLAAAHGTLTQIANRLHSRIVTEVLGKDQPHLTTRELECLRWVALGKDAKDIATILKISPHTTRDYLKSVHYKLDCATSAQAVTKAIKLGLLTL